MNSYKIDEQQVKKSNFETMPRFFKYLFKVDTVIYLFSINHLLPYLKPH